MLTDIEMVDKFMEFRQHYYLLNESELQLIIDGQPNTKERLSLAKKIDNFENKFDNFAIYINQIKVNWNKIFFNRAFSEIKAKFV